jgi:hypothetical protein
MVENGRALYHVAGVDQDAIVAAGTLAPERGGQVGEPAALALQRHHAGMQVIGVENGERTDFRRRVAACKGAGKKGEDQPPAGREVHTAHCIV